MTNAPTENLTLEQAVLTYWDEWLIERGFHRLKGVPLSLSPLFFKRDDQVAGLIENNPKKGIDNPERLLKMFANITLTIVHLPGQTVRHLPTLTAVQTRILSCSACLQLSTLSWSRIEKCQNIFSEWTVIFFQIKKFLHPSIHLITPTLPAAKSPWHKYCPNHTHPAFSY